MECKKAILDGKFEGLLDAFQPPLAYKLKKQGNVITAHPYYSALLPAVNEIVEGYKISKTEYGKIKSENEKINKQFSKLDEKFESLRMELRKEIEEKQKKNEELETIISALKNDIEVLQNDLWNYRAERWLPNERFMIVRDKETDKQKKIDISKEVRNNINNIENYITDVKGDICIFDWGERMHRKDLNYLATHLPEILSQKSEKKEVKTIRDIETILLNEDYKGAIDQRMKDVWNKLVDICRYKYVKFKDIVNICKEICGREKVRKYLRIFEDKNLIDRKKGGNYKIIYEL